MLVLGEMLNIVSTTPGASNCMFYIYASEINLLLLPQPLLKVLLCLHFIHSTYNQNNENSTTNNNNLLPRKFLT